MGDTGRDPIRVGPAKSLTSGAAISTVWGLEFTVPGDATGQPRQYKSLVLEV